MGIFSSSLSSDTKNHRDLLQRQLELHNVLLTSAQSNRQDSLAMTHLATIERLVTLIVGNDSQYSTGGKPTKRRRVDDDADADDVDEAEFDFGPDYGCPKRFCRGFDRGIDRGSGRRGEQNGVDFDQYDRDPRCGDRMSAENAEQWYSEENMYKEERRADRTRMAENGHGFIMSDSFDADSDTDDSFVVSDELVEFEDFEQPEFECDDDSEFECDDESDSDLDSDSESDCDDDSEFEHDNS